MGSWAAAMFGHKPCHHSSLFGCPFSMSVFPLVPCPLPMAPPAPCLAVHVLAEDGKGSQRRGSHAPRGPRAPRRPRVLLGARHQRELGAVPPGLPTHPRVHSVGVHCRLIGQCMDHGFRYVVARETQAHGGKNFVGLMLAVCTWAALKLQVEGCSDHHVEVTIFTLLCPESEKRSKC